MLFSMSVIPKIQKLLIKSLHLYAPLSESNRYKGFFTHKATKKEDFYNFSIAFNRVLCNNLYYIVSLFTRRLK